MVQEWKQNFQGSCMEFIGVWENSEDMGGGESIGVMQALQLLRSIGDKSGKKGHEEHATKPKIRCRQEMVEEVKMTKPESKMEVQQFPWLEERTRIRWRWKRSQNGWGRFVGDGGLGCGRIVTKGEFAVEGISEGIESIRN
ncbi:hypothetical protein COLO4_35910 [Corchorus olitorius]|uniref:Uncharacterized protein n=1 Tax=Corchorus olitorius TaxID=93759 RepID=A0A1R3GC69_9ROSI|nr:hypothetical protein COLO4_35910 [Corchorus olitorius]